jgi:hypothetical protein
VTLRPDATSSEDLRGFSLHGRQSCWYHSEDIGAALAELGALARFLRDDAFDELSRFASDEKFPDLLAHRSLARGPNDVLEAIVLHLRGDREGTRRILRGEIPKKNRFIPEIYPGILDRLESLAGP